MCFTLSDIFSSCLEKTLDNVLNVIFFFCESLYVCNVKEGKKKKKKNNFFFGPKINFNNAMFLFLTVAYRIACKTSSATDKEACNITQKKKKVLRF